MAATETSDDQPPDHATHAALADGAVLAHLDRPTAAERTRVAVVADAHVADPDADESWKVYHHTRTRVTDAVADLADAALHVSGHVHLPGVVDARGVRGLVAVPLSSFPQAYLGLDVGPGGTTVRCHTAADRDGVAEAYRLARQHSARSRRIAAHTGGQLSTLPVVDGRGSGRADT